MSKVNMHRPIGRSIVCLFSSFLFLFHSLSPHLLVDWSIPWLVGLLLACLFPLFHGCGQAQALEFQPLKFSTKVLLPCFVI